MALSIRVSYKDGCVRVSAPIVEDRIEYQDIQGKYTYGNFSIYVGKYFKKGALQDKKRESYNIIVAKMNGIINSILHASTVQDAQDDWWYAQPLQNLLPHPESVGVDVISK